MNYAIILSGGVGNRMGLDIPKQYYEVKNKPIIRFVIDTLERCGEITGFVIVADKEWREYILKHVKETNRFLGFAEPGENRQLSVYSGLMHLVSVGVSDEDLVLVQDAARPNTSVELIENCFSIAKDEDGAIPVLPMKDTVYLSRDGKQLTSLLNRSEIFAGQAPESFRFGKYRKANEALLPDKILLVNGSTEPAIMAGMNIRMLPGEETNFKITTKADLARFEQIVKEGNVR